MAVNDFALNAIHRENVALLKLQAALQPLRGYFRSGNSIPVSQAIIRTKDWAPIEEILKELDELA